MSDTTSAACGLQISRRTLLLGAVATASWAGRTWAASSQSVAWATSLTARAAAAHIARGDFTAERYVAALAEQADRLKDLNVFTAENRDGMLEGARAIDQRRKAGDKLGSLAGVPLLVKANIDTASMATTAATPALAQNRPAHDAIVLDRLFAVDALLFGKANMDEMAGGVTSTNAVYGAVHNPYLPSRVTGGSSGGTAAGISARIAPAGLGTDTVGSGRLPASLCGVVGFRSTAGRYPGGGHVPNSHTRDAIAPMARTVADVALMDQVITGRQSATPGVLHGMRLGLPKAFFWSGLDAETEAVAQDSIEQLREAGVEFVDVDLPNLPKLLEEVGPILPYEAIADLENYLKDQGSYTTVEQVVAGIRTPAVQQFYRSFLAGTDAFAYRAALDVYRPQLQKLFADAFTRTGVAAMCFPCAPITAPLIGQQTVVLGGSEMPLLQAYARNGNPAAAAGLPALVVPAGLSRSGLPVGLEFDGRSGGDRDLLSLGLAAELLLPPLPPPALA